MKEFLMSQEGQVQNKNKEVDIMVIVFKNNVCDEHVENVIKKLTDMGLDIHKSTNPGRIFVIVLGDKRGVDISDIQTMEGVLGVHRVTEPYLKASREYQKENSVIRVGDIRIGLDDIAIMAGPCTLESHEQLYSIASVIRKRGVRILRGGAFKPRTSPYAFQGLGADGLRMMKDIAKDLGMYIVSEILDIRDLDLFSNTVDIIQVGSRNMNNFSLLKELGRIQLPIMLKRGMAATIEEWLLAAEYILVHGNPDIILCERGTKGFEPLTRFSLDLASVSIINARSHLPVIVDPSHSSGNRDLVIPMARAAVAAGAQGLMVEVHTDPFKAKCDGSQSLYPEQFLQLMDDIDKIAKAIGRRISC